MLAPELVLELVLASHSHVPQADPCSLHRCAPTHAPGPTHVWVLPGTQTLPPAPVLLVTAAPQSQAPQREPLASQICAPLHPPGPRQPWVLPGAQTCPPLLVLSPPAPVAPAPPAPPDIAPPSPLEPPCPVELPCPVDPPPPVAPPCPVEPPSPVDPLLPLTMPAPPEPLSPFVPPPPPLPAGVPSVEDPQAAPSPADTIPSQAIPRKRRVSSLMVDSPVRVAGDALPSPAGRQGLPAAGGDRIWPFRPNDSEDLRGKCPHSPRARTAPPSRPIRFSSRSAPRAARTPRGAASRRPSGP